MNVPRLIVTNEKVELLACSVLEVWLLLNDIEKQLKAAVLSWILLLLYNL
jgi:hypothetical protein